MTRLKRLEVELMKLERNHDIWRIKFLGRFAAYRAKLVERYGEEKVNEWELKGESL